MDPSISLGNVLTIIVIIVGFFWHYHSMYTNLIVRLVTLEVKQEQTEQDVDHLFNRRRSEQNVNGS